MTDSHVGGDTWASCFFANFFKMASSAFMGMEANPWTATEFVTLLPELNFRLTRLSFGPLYFNRPYAQMSRQIPQAPRLCLRVSLCPYYSLPTSQLAEEKRFGYILESSVLGDILPSGAVPWWSGFPQSRRTSCPAIFYKKYHRLISSSVVVIRDGPFDFRGGRGWKIFCKKILRHRKAIRKSILDKLCFDWLKMSSLLSVGEKNSSPNQIFQPSPIKSQIVHPNSRIWAESDLSLFSLGIFTAINYQC